jgi:DNA-binding transcriptional MocR family regulator
LLRPEALADALRPIGAVGTDAARTRFAQFAACGEWQPRPDELLFSGNGRQAITAALSALVPAGGRLGVEALTYPVVKGLAQRLGIALVPLPMDDAGIIPGALADAHRSTPLRAVYLQPRAHNPLGISWPAYRRADLVDVLRACDLPVIEDAVWSFLAEAGPEAEPEPELEAGLGPEPESVLGPLAAQMPERTVLIDSLSKRLAPGLSVGFVVAASDALRSGVANALRSMAAAPGAFALESAVRWLGDGTVAEIVEGKRADAAKRQRLARELLARQTLRSDQRSYYVWWELPEPWRAETFVASAHAKGIAVTSGEAFAADPRSTPRAVRIALASPPLDVLGRALTTLREIAVGGVDQSNGEGGSGG